MRELKFRAWDKKEKNWCPAFVINNIGDAHSSYGIIDSISGNISYWKENVILMQYTGLKDKNKKEIYESDIVKWSDGNYVHPSNPRIAEVKFDPELCFFAVNCDSGRGHKFGFSNFIYTDTKKHLEIIGNIYENPELLT
jgi:uncharacterized phage protein (TIGR01671 family)